MTELLKLELEGFGGFAKQKEITFKKGINFISGLNETGKSTILEALLACLFKYTPAKITPYFCWHNKDTCKLALTYKTDEGETFRITCDYLNGQRKLEKIVKGKEKEITTIDVKIKDYVKQHFGFDEQKVFENTTFIRQSQMAILGDKIVKNKVKDMIEEVLVGTAQASATGALQKIQKEEKAARKEFENLEACLPELRQDFEKAEENKEIMKKDSSDFDKASKELSEKAEKLKKLKDSYEKFEQKEDLTKEQENTKKQVKRIDKTLAGIDEAIKNKEKIEVRLENYQGYASIPSEDLSEIKDLIKKIDNAQSTLGTYLKSGIKKTIVNERLNLKYVILLLVGIALCITIVGIIIGLPLAVYSYKRMKIKEEQEVTDGNREKQIEELKSNSSEYESKLGNLTKKIKDFNRDTFLEQYSKYSDLLAEIKNQTDSIKELIKAELEKEEIEKDENENVKKIEARKRDLLNDLSVIENNLKKYKLVAFNEDDLNELKKLEGDVEKLKERKVELDTSVKKTKELVRSPEEIKEELDSTEERIKDLKEKAEEHSLAYKFLEKAEAEVHHKFTPSIEKNSKSLLKGITNGKYSDLKIDEEALDIQVKSPEKKDYVDVDVLSQGAKDQLYFTVRTSMTNLLSGNINIPLILDDPFHNFDEPRLKNTIEAIKEIAKKKQIILISHRPYHKEFHNFATNVIELK